MNARIAALRFVGHALSIDISTRATEALRHMMTSGLVDWPAVVTLANINRITPALWVALRNRGVAQHLPPDLGDYLREIHRLNVHRNEVLRQQALEAIEQLTSLGSQSILLKGAAALFVPTFAEPGARVMTDIDLLVPRDEAEHCWSALRTLGYVPVEDPVDYPKMHHLAPLHRPGCYGTIEVHTELLHPNFTCILPPELAWQHVERYFREGLEIRVLSPTYRVLHNIAHSALADRGYSRGEMPLLPLFELANMASRHDGHIMWDAIAEIMRLNRKSAVLASYIHMAHQVFGAPKYARTGPALTARLHYARCRLQAGWEWLQPLVDRVSWFSAIDISVQYGCDQRFLPVTHGRIRLAHQRIANRSRRVLQWVGIIASAPTPGEAAPQTDERCSARGERWQ